MNWSTPRNEGFDAGGHRGGQDSFHSQVKNWPTAHGMENENHPRKNGPSGNELGFAGHAEERKSWPTPTQQDGENNGGPSQTTRNTHPLNAVVAHSQNSNGGGMTERTTPG